jgi:hypothetical protein
MVRAPELDLGYGAAAHWLLLVALCKPAADTICHVLFRDARTDRLAVPLPSCRGLMSRPMFWA